MTSTRPEAGPEAGPQAPAAITPVVGPAAVTPILRFEDVRLQFAGVKAIDGVSFEVGRHELFAIIGPNGAGKTSIFNVVSGVYRPQSGRIVFNPESNAPLDRDRDIDLV